MVWSERLLTIPKIYILTYELWEDEIVEISIFSGEHLVRSIFALIKLWMMCITSKDLYKMIDLLKKCKKRSGVR